MTAIDIVVPAHQKDFRTLRYAVRAALRHVSPIRRLHVVSGDPFYYPDDRVGWVPEPALPRLPTLSDVRARWAQSNPDTARRASWVYQQLLKLGAGEYIEGLLDQYLVIDSDVVFLRPVSFDPDLLGRFPYSRAFEYHVPYREAYERLFGAPPSTGFSLTAHHMLCDRALMAEMQRELEQRHGRAWYDAYLDGVNEAEASSISEWNVYGWWALDRHPEHGRVRQLVWRDVRLVPGLVGRAVMAADFDFVASHAWARQTRRRQFAALGPRLAAEAWALLRR